MDFKPERCMRCGSEKQILFQTDYICNFCEKPENKEKTESFAFTLLNPEWVEITKESIIPAGTRVDLFKWEDEARYVVETIPVVQLALVKITFETDINWASIFGSNPHTLQRDTPFEVIEL